MIKIKYLLLTVITTGLTAITSCKVTKAYKQPGTDNISRLYRDLAVADTTSIASLPWTTLYTDNVLQKLIKEGLAHSNDLKTAIQRINEARATLQQTKAAFFPTLSSDVSVTPSKSSQAALNFPAGLGISTKTTTYQAELTTSWEADIWGKLNSSKKAALASLLESDASKRAVQTQLIADIANDYYSLLSQDEQLRITLETIKVRIKDVETTKALKEGNVVNGASVVQSEANRYSAEVTVPDLRQNIRELENTLCVLLGRAPGNVERTSLAEQQPIADLKTGIPSQLLKNRPDVQEAEYTYRAAFENTNLARAYFYPSFTISGSGGISALTLGNLFANSVFANAVGTLTQPIFNQGANKARLRTYQAQQEEALNSFQQSLLTAGQEVSNALFSYQAALDKQQIRQKQLASLQKSVDFTKALLQYSSATNYIDVLTSEQNLLTAQINGVSDKLQQLQAVVNLYKALGGGWKN